MCPCSDVRVDRRPSEKAMFGRRCSISGRCGIGHSELIISRYGLRRVRVGEASNRGPSRERSPSDILCRLETVLTRLDSSGEEPCERNVASSVSVTTRFRLRMCMPDDLRDGWFWPLNLGCCKIFRATGSKFWSQCRIKRVHRVMWFQTFPASPNALHEAGVFGPSTISSHFWPKVNFFVVSILRLSQQDHYGPQRVVSSQQMDG